VVDGDVRIRPADDGGAVIALRSLTRRFGTRTVVDDVTFDIGRAEIVALLGPNGAGKTTTLRMLAGLIAPTSGSVVLDGVELTPHTGTMLRQRIGFLTETPALWDRLTVRENLAIYADLYGLDRPGARVDRLLEVFGLTAHASARAAELSKGMRQKVAIGRALLHDPDMLLLDEPTSGLDPEVSKAVRDLLDEHRSRGCAILLSTHNLHEAERQADRIAVLQRRLLALDTPLAMRNRLTTGRTVIRVRDDAAAWLPTIRSIDHQASAHGSCLTIELRDPNGDTPSIVSALAAAGALILEVRPETPALEDIYLHLVGEHP
jgi:ABC-2 type transport system ATP-binding protein